MKCFLINLDKNQDRLKYMDAQLKKLGVEYERFPGILGAGLCKSELKKAHNAFRGLLVNGGRLTKGEVGCAMSHNGIYKRIVETGVDKAIVLEDDVALSDRFPSIIEDASRFVDPKRKQVILFSGHALSQEECEKESGVVSISGGTCADAYMITRLAAMAILAGNDPVVTVCDRWIRFQKRYGVEMYRVFPITARQDKAQFPGSNVSEFPTRPRGFALFVRKLIRAVELFIDWIIFLFTGR